ncbi:MAG: Sec-independent protein translocase protein TatB [Pseudomonadota bacterium]
MIDFGFDKLALIGAVALIVIGPERLPRVARTVGHLLGKAQRYVADVKAEVNRTIELEELKKMKGQFEDAARGVEQTMSHQMKEASHAMDEVWAQSILPPNSGQHDGDEPVPHYQHPRKRWRLKRAAMPQWYKQRHGVRAKAQSGAARVARFRPTRPPSS